MGGNVGAFISGVTAMLLLQENKQPKIVEVINNVEVPVPTNKVVEINGNDVFPQIFNTPAAAGRIYDLNEDATTETVAGAYVSIKGLKGFDVINASTINAFVTVNTAFVMPLGLLKNLRKIKVSVRRVDTAVDAARNSSFELLNITKDSPAIHDASTISWFADQTSGFTAKEGTYVTAIRTGKVNIPTLGDRIIKGIYGAAVNGTTIAALIKSFPMPVEHIELHLDDVVDPHIIINTPVGNFDVAYDQYKTQLAATDDCLVNVNYSAKFSTADLETNVAANTMIFTVNDPLITLEID